MSVAKSFWTERIPGVRISRFAALRAGVTAFKDLRKGDLYAELPYDQQIADKWPEYVADLDADLDELLVAALRNVDPARAKALRERLDELDQEREDLLLHLAQIEQAQKYGGK